MSEKNLPKGWELLKLGQVMPQTRNINPAIDSDKKFVLWSVPVWPHAPEILKGSKIGSTKQIVYNDDILLCKINPRINRVWVIRNFSEQEVQIASSEWIVLRSKYLCPEFIACILSAPEFRYQLCMNVSGVGGSLTRARPTDVKEYSIPISPLTEQRRIAVRVEALQARRAKAKEALEEALRLLEKFRQSALAAAFRGDLTARWREEHPDAEPASVFLQHIRQERRKRWEEAELAKYATKGKTPPKDWKKKYPEPVAVNTEGLPDLPAGWCWATVEDCFFVETGATPQKSNSTYYKGGTIPWITSSSTNGDQISKAQAFITEKAVNDTNCKVLPVGTLVIAMYGEGKTRGNVSELAIECATNQACACLICFDVNHVFRSIVKNFFKLQYLKIRQSASGGVQNNLNLEIIKRFAIPVLPEKELAVLDHALRHVMSRFSKLILHCSSIREGITELNQSILSKAFNGEMVAQDPTDEPARVLLERIAAEAAILSASDAKPQQARRGRKTKPGVAPAMVFPAAGREQRLLRLMEYIIYAYPGLSTTVVEEQAKLATYPAVCATLLGSRASTFRKALRESGEGWKFSKADVVRFGRLWESLEANYGIRISSEGLCTMRKGREPAPWPAMDALLPFFNKAYTIFIAKRHKYEDVQVALDSIGVMQKIA